MSFDGKKLVLLEQIEVGANKSLYGFLLLDGEEVLFEYKSIRDCLVVTTSRLICIDVQGLRGRKREYMSIPFSKIAAFSVESSGTLDLDAEFKVWASGLGMVEFGLHRKTPVEPIAHELSKRII